MQKIMGNKLYDTDEAEIISTCKGRHERKRLLKRMINGKALLLKTEKGQYLIYHPRQKTLEKLSEYNAMDLLKKTDIQTYMKIFGEVEEG